jgi:hypothetical protein
MGRSGCSRAQTSRGHGKGAPVTPALGRLCAIPLRGPPISHDGVAGSRPTRTDRVTPPEDEGVLRTTAYQTRRVVTATPQFPHPRACPIKGKGRPAPPTPFFQGAPAAYRRFQLTADSAHHFQWWATVQAVSAGWTDSSTGKAAMKLSDWLPRLDGLGKSAPSNQPNACFTPHGLTRPWRIVTGPGRNPRSKGPLRRSRRPWPTPW